MGDVVELAEVPKLFERWLAGRPLADRSRREYARNVRAYCEWLPRRRIGMAGTGGLADRPREEAAATSTGGGRTGRR